MPESTWDDRTPSHSPSQAAARRALSEGTALVVPSPQVQATCALAAVKVQGQLHLCWSLLPVCRAALPLGPQLFQKTAGGWSTYQMLVVEEVHHAGRPVAHGDKVRGCSVQAQQAQGGTLLHAVHGVSGNKHQRPLRRTSPCTQP